MGAKLVCGLALLMTVGLSGSTKAQQPKLIGTWFVSVDKDRFTGDPSVMAVTVHNGSMLALRCLEKSLTFAVKDEVVSGLTAGELFSVVFKGGDHPVTNTMADAVSDSLIEIMVTDEIRANLLNSDEFAFRFKGDNQQFDSIFPAGTAARSLPAVINACPPTPKD